MRSVARPLCLTIFGVSWIHAAVVTNVSCGAYGYSATSASAQCNQGSAIPFGLNSSAAASVTTSVTMPATTSDFVISTIYESVSATGAPLSSINRLSLGASDATAIAGVHLNLFSGGSERN